MNMKKSTRTLVILIVAELFLALAGWALMSLVQSISYDPIAYAERARSIFIVTGALMGAVGGFLLFQWFGQSRAER